MENAKRGDDVLQRRFKKCLCFRSSIYLFEFLDVGALVCGKEHGFSVSLSFITVDIQVQTNFIPKHIKIEFFFFFWKAI